MYRPSITFMLCIASCFLLQVVKGQDMFGDFAQRKEKAIARLKEHNKPDTARVNALINVFTTAIFSKQQAEVKPYCDEALVASKRLKYTKGIGECYLFIAGFNRTSGNIAVAQSYYDSVIDLSNESKDSSLRKLRAQAYRWKGVISYGQEDYYEALPFFFEALKYFDYDIGKVTVFLYSDMANIYIKLNNLDQAAFYAAKNVALTEKSFPKMYQADAYLSLVDIYIQKNELSLASAYLDKMKPLMPDKDETLVDFTYYADRGRISYLMKQYDSSFSYYQQAYNYAVLSKHDINVQSALYYLSGISLKRGNLKAAKQYAEENLLLAEQTNSKRSKVDALMNLSDYYHRSGNSSKAYELLQKATGLKDSVLSETNIRQANTLAAVYETGKKQKEILRLKDEKEMQAVSLAKNATLNKVFISTIIGLLIFVYLAYRTVKNEQKIAVQRQEIQKQKINELEKDRKLLTAEAMLKGQEEERSRIAKDLHDGLGGMLSGVKLSLNNMKENIFLSPENQQSFERSIGMLDQTINELRKVAHNLMPDILVKFGLDEALKEFCCSIETSTGIDVIYQQLGEDRKLSPQAEITIYRIVQELVNNTLKHADAKQIIVQLTKNHVKAGVTVEDDGNGFDVNDPSLKKGAGLINVMSRVDYFKGTLDINSQPGKGTSVNIELIA